MSRVSVDFSHPRPCSGNKTLRRFQNVEDGDHTILIDVDSENPDNVVIIDVPESVPRKDKGSSRLKKDNGWLFENVICIDDDDDDDDYETHDAHCPLGAKNGSSTFDATSSRQPHKNACDSDEECGFVPENINPVRLSKCKRTYSGKGSASNRYGLNIDSEGESSDNEDVDCEIMEDSSGKVQELWEKAFSKRARKYCGPSRANVSDSTSGAFNEDHFNNLHHNMSDTLGKSGAQANASSFVFDFHEDPVDLEQGSSRDHTDGRGENLSSFKSADERFDHPMPEFYQTTPEVEPHSNELHHNSSCNEYVWDETTINKCQNIFESETDPSMSCPTDNCERVEDKRTCNANEMEIFEQEEPKTNGIAKETDEDSTHKFSLSNNILDSGDDDKIGFSDQDTEGSVISEREKLKETDEYKKALEEEWASRRQALQIQAEEAQRERRLLKRRKAESLRLLDMERRQKERVEEVRNTQKKDEENMNMKAAIQANVRERLNNLELQCHSFATLLHLLGINITGWPYPSPQAVQAAYKRALLTYHPDRTSQSDLHRQVEAEETFKLINRLKEKFSPSL